MNAIDLIVLPRLTAPGALALAEQLLSTAAPHKKDFPSIAGAARANLTEARNQLAAALRDKVDPTSNNTEPPQLDRDIDSAYASLASFVDAFVRLPDGGELAEHARMIQATVFPDGLRFTQLAYPLEWAESQIRIERMATPEVTAALKGLGAKTFVDAIRAKHEAYGKALGMGAAKSVAAAPAVRPAYENALAAMRWYVIKVVASADPSAPESQALVDELLVPLTTWSVGAGRRSNGERENLATEPTKAALPATPAAPATPEGAPGPVND
ncbi:MAG: hypothetical protein R3F14_35890 [Polyangiaceae bacterium]